MGPGWSFFTIDLEFYSKLLLACFNTSLTKQLFSFTFNRHKEDKGYRSLENREIDWEILSKMQTFFMCWRTALYKKALLKH